MSRTGTHAFAMSTAGSKTIGGSRMPLTETAVPSADPMTMGFASARPTARQKDARPAVAASSTAIEIGGNTRSRRRITGAG